MYVTWGKKTPAIYKNIRSFDKSATFNGIKVLSAPVFAVELAIFMGVDSGPERKNIMAYADELYSFLDKNYDVPPKKTKFPERFNLCGSFNDECS